MHLIMYNILYPLTNIYPTDCHSSLNKSCRTKGIFSDYLVSSGKWIDLAHFFIGFKQI